MDAIRAVFFTLYHSGFNFPSMSYFYGKFCVSSRYYYLSYNSFHMSNHTDSCQPVPFLNNLIVMKDGHCQWFMPNLYYIIY